MRSGRRSPRALAASNAWPDEPFEPRAPLVLRLGANVAAVAFQKVVGDEGDRQLAHRLVADDLAPEPLLEAREGLEAVERIRRRVSGRRRHHHELAVDGDARRAAARASGSRSG